MNMLKTLKKDKKGFTLIEIVIVLVIIAILAAMLIPSMMGWIDDSKQKSLISEANSVKTAVEAEVVIAYANGETCTPAGFTASEATKHHWANIEKKLDKDVKAVTSWGISANNKVTDFTYKGDDYDATYKSVDGKMQWVVGNKK
ncbi:MAG: prepilin-type N-terminal cleavage/methylation domain-containing protein [Oscillospiraceae bacterium]